MDLGGYPERGGIVLDRAIRSLERATPTGSLARARVRTGECPWCSKYDNDGRSDGCCCPSCFDSRLAKREIDDDYYCNGCPLRA